MNLLLAALVVLSISCSGTTPLRTQTPVKVALAPDKVNISNLYACFKYDESHLEIVDNKNGFMKIGSQINGSVREGYSTLHLFRHHNMNLIGWLDYACGPACEQEIKWYRITRDCKIKEVPSTKFLATKVDGRTRFLSLPKKGYDLFVVEAEAIEVYPEYEMRIEEKYTWKDGSFHKDESFEGMTLPMTQENVNTYFQYGDG